MRAYEHLYLALVAASLTAAAAAPIFFDPPANGGYTDYIQEPFTNWETPQVHPIDLTPDRSKLLVCNTADGRLEIFDVSSGFPAAIGSVPVGIDPVSVRAASNTQAWVVNHLSDSVSIVDLASMRVTSTLKTDDEPCDVVFAGTPRRAFVSCSQVNRVQVFDATAPSTPVGTVAIDGEDPRALAVSPDGSTVFAAIFESGNSSTILGGGGQANGGATVAFPPNVVSHASGPYGGQNPPPNSGNAFMPPIAATNLPAIPVSLIVKKDAGGAWRDDNNRDWTSFVSGANASLSGRVAGWDLYDHDIAMINADSLAVSYTDRLMNACMALAVNPVSGQVALVGTDAINQVRFEPNLNGRFLRVNIAMVSLETPNSTAITDLNPHLTYASPTIPQVDRNKSIGDPRAIVFTPAGDKAYVAGMGSNNVIRVNASGQRTPAETINVGEGPTGLALDASRSRLYVLNRFAATISVINTDTDTVIDSVPFFDPTPNTIKVGRKHLYDTHRNSGLGHVACASCHLDSRMDRLSWDLGDPQGTIDPLTNRNLGQGLPGLAPATAPVQFRPFHPMKGPMATQTLQDIIGHEPHHWRGDRLGIEEFNAAFIGLQGDDASLTNGEMQEFENFLATITYPPNPFRNLDNTLPANLPLPGHYRTGRFGNAGQPLPNGNALVGLSLYRSQTRRLDNNAFACVTCHTLPTGAGTNYTLVGLTYQPLAVGPRGEQHAALVSVDGTSNISTKIPQLRNLYEKTGFNAMLTRNTAGFGVLHDGSVDSIERFITEPVFTLANDQEVADMTAFMLAFSGSDLPAGSVNSPLEPPGTPSRDTHAAVGRQTTLVSIGSAPPEQVTLMNQMVALADAGKVGLIAKGVVGGVARGYAYLGSGQWQSDRRSQTLTTAALHGLAAPGSEITFTVVVRGSSTRLGLDRDQDTWYDRDELDVCDNPADPTNYPGGRATRDLNADGVTDFNDYLEFLNRFNSADPRADYNNDGTIDFNDYLEFLNRYNQVCPA